MIKDALIYLHSLFMQTPKPERLESCDLDYLVFPENSSFKVLDEFRNRPRRLKQNVEFTTLGSLIEYIKIYQGNKMLVTGNRDNKDQIVAILDYHNPIGPTPSWCEHVAILKAIITPEWKTWADNEKKRMSQRLFAAFMEDNAEDIKAPLADLITKITNVTIGASGSTKSKVTTTEEGLESSRNVNVTSGLPDIIELGLRPWQYSEPYLVKARPFIHITEGKAPEFSYHLVNLDRVKDAAFRKAITTVADGTGLVVYV